MKQPILVVLALFSVLVLAGCGPATGTDTSPFIGGLSGLKISFIEGAPPPLVSDAGQEPFSVGVQFENVGESDVGVDTENSDNRYASIEVVGIDPNQFGNPDLVKSFADDGLTLFGTKRIGTQLIEGGIGVLYLENFNYQPDVFGNQDHTIRVNACYDYTTYTNTKVCIKTNTQERVEDNNICVLAGAKDTFNSGAPVHVVNFIERPQGKGKIGITFNIANVGTGTIFRRSGEQVGTGTFLNQGYCSDPSVQNPNFNRVYVRLTFPNSDFNKNIFCQNLAGNYASNEGEVTLFNGAPATVSCTITVDPSQDLTYTSVLNIDLKYTYLESINTPLVVRDVSAGAPIRN